MVTDVPASDTVPATAITPEYILFTPPTVPIFTKGSIITPLSSRLVINSSPVSGSVLCLEKTSIFTSGALSKLSVISSTKFILPFIATYRLSGVLIPTVGGVKSNKNFCDTICPVTICYDIPISWYTTLFDVSIS